MTDKWAKLPSKNTIDITIESLKNNGIDAHFVNTGEEAKAKVLSMIPSEAEVMNMTSVTLDTIGISKELESKDYKLARDKLNSQDISKREKKMIGAAPEYALGSAHAVTENGEIIVASNTGSQLPAYAYGSDHVILVVGAQKIVKNLDEGMKRLYEHTLPLESERARKAYSVPGSNVSKILIINKEIHKDRIHLIFVNEVLGF